jgi:hypothetical protein
LSGDGRRNGSDGLGVGAQAMIVLDLLTNTPDDSFRNPIARPDDADDKK